MTFHNPPANTADYVVKLAETQAEIAAAAALRRAVFCDEQQIFEQCDCDEIDEDAMPIVALTYPLHTLREGTELDEENVDLGRARTCPVNEHGLRQEGRSTHGAGRSSERPGGSSGEERRSEGEEG